MVSKNEPLCEVTAEALDVLARDPGVLVEVGAGDGTWQLAMREYGLPVMGVDIDPRGPGVFKGNHLDATRLGATRMLAVWPPDGSCIQDWIRAAPWEYVYICASPHRIDLGNVMDDYRPLLALDMPPSLKGDSVLMAWARLPQI